MSAEDSLSLERNHDMYVNLLHHLSLEILDKSIRIMDLILSVIGLTLPLETTVEVREAVDRNGCSFALSDTCDTVRCQNKTNGLIINVLIAFSCLRSPYIRDYHVIADVKSCSDGA